MFINYGNNIDGGGFIILDLVGFYILFEGLLIPMFLIIGGWGLREEKVQA